MGPVVLRYKERWGPTALSTRFTVSRHTHRQNLTQSSKGRSQRQEAPSPGRRRRWTTSSLHRHWNATSLPPSLPTRWTVPAPPSPPMVGTSVPLSLLDLVVHVLGHVYPILVKSVPLDLHLSSIFNSGFCDRGKDKIHSTVVASALSDAWPLARPFLACCKRDA